MTTQRSDLLPAGTVLGGRYSIVEHLASGGMAEVYVAMQAPLGRRVAVKVLNLEGRLDEALTRRFHQEAVALSRLTHPNTITIFDFGTTDDGQFYLVMELLDGESLSARLSRDGALPVEDAVDVAVQVARSLSEAHALGIVHRDLKPDNIFLGRVERNLVKVLDFGIATGQPLSPSERKLTRQGMVPGTPEYMSPEHAQGLELDGRSDIYSLAVVLYEMLTGSVPFTGPTAVSIVLQHVNAPAPSLPGGFAAPLRAFLRRALSKERDERPADAQRFVDELIAAAGNQVSAGSSSHARRSLSSAPAVARREPQAGPPPPPPPTDEDAEADERPPPPRRASTMAPPPAAAPPRPARNRTPQEVFLDFAEPVLEKLGPSPRAPALKRNLEFASSAWNAVVGGSAALDESREWLARNGTPQMVHVFETLVSRKEREFGAFGFEIDGVEVETSLDGAAESKIRLK